MRDRVYSDELLIEDTHDWYAQDDDGNVWYMGEEVDNYEYDDEGNLVSVDHDGAWEAGLDVAGAGSNAIPGHLMLASPQVGTSYRQEYYDGEAEDMGLVVATGVDVELEDGTAYPGCLQVLDWNPLEPDALEYKLFAPGVGLIQEANLVEAELSEKKGTFEPGPASIPDFGAATFSNPSLVDNPYLSFLAGNSWTYEVETDEGLERIDVDVLAGTRTVMGIECAVVQDRVVLDGVLIEDTHDWYAQDDDGNVWYMGEDVDNYEYDDEGNLLEVNHDGAWEAGLDPAGTGSVALPGYNMLAAPVAGQGYHQEYYEDEATDMGFVVATDVTVELEDGTVFEGCVQILDWNPLEPDGLEYKYFAPGVGLVLEEVLHDDERVELRI